MLRHFTLINFILAGVILLVFRLFYQGYSALERIDIGSIEATIDKAMEKTDDLKEEGENGSRRSGYTHKMDNIQEYSIVAENNLFHPDRKLIETKASEEKKPERVKPDLVLYGTMITDGVRIAFVEDRKNPYKTPGRGKRQKTIKVGDQLSGYNVVEINSDSVVLASDGDTAVFRIEDSTQDKHRTVSQPPGSQNIQQPAKRTPANRDTIRKSLLK